MKRNQIYLLVLIFVFSGCSVTRHAVPEGMLGTAKILGRKDIRTVSGKPEEYLLEDLLSLIESKANNDPISGDNKENESSVLAISGGAAAGAYGAGLIKGWSKAGSRPNFDIITGISTGAIIAPLAFLGSQYDDKLEEFYTTHETKDIFRIKGILKMIFGNSLASNKPLIKLIKKHFTDEILSEIAIEHRKGRRLYVGTTNLDAQRLIIWDMGKIASMRDKESLKLFRKVILASASIPTAFPPVYFDAEIEGEVYNEMHVDGGVKKQVFFIYDVLRDLESALNKKNMDVSTLNYSIFVIRNGYAEPTWKEIPDKVKDITERSIDAMTNAQGLGDLYRIYMFTREVGGDFNLAYIPKNHVYEPRETFDPIEMRKFFDLGFFEASQGYKWRKIPPGLELFELND